MAHEPAPPASADYFFVRRPIVAIVISIVTVIGGLVAMGGLPIAQFPEIVPPEIQVSATYTGADALTIEQSVATPIEQQVNGVDYMIYLRSVNANDGTMTLRVSFEVETNIDMDNVLVQNRVNQASASLPPDVRNFGVTVKKSTSSPLLLFSLYSPNGSYGDQFLGNYANINIVDALKRVPGVGDVVIFGTSDYAMRIWVKPDQLTSLGLTVPDLIDAIQKQNTVNPSGKIGGEPAPAGQEFTWSVRAQGRLVSAEEFGAIVVRSDPSGAQVRLRDVARIELGALNYNQRGRLDGKPAAIVATYQIPGSNALEVAEGLKRTMEEAKARFPQDLDYATSLDTTLAVSEGIVEIGHTLYEAMILVILVVFLFLQSWRATLIPLIAVPVSLVGAFAVFPLLGFSINTLSLFGLVLAIGLVVDDAIVVVEAVQHHIEHGMSPREATNRAMKEVGGPVIAIALVLSAVFVPVAFVPGITGRMYQQFALTIAISVIISAINALTLSPALCSLLLKPAAASTGLLGRFFAAFNRVFDRATNGYVGVTGVCVRRAGRSLVGLVALTAAAGLLGWKLPTGFVPDEDQGYLFVNVQLPDAASMERTDAVCKQVEAILADTEGVGAYNTIAGYSLISQSSATYNAFFFVSLEPWHERTTPETGFKAILATLNRRLAAIPGAQVFAFLPPPIQGIGTGGGFSVMLQDRSGGSVEALARNLDAFLQALRERPEIATAFSPFRASVPQIYAEVDRDKALKQGVDLRSVYSTLQAFMGGAYVNDFNRFGRQWKVFLQAEPEYRRRAEDIGAFYVRNADLDMVPLSTLVESRDVGGPEFTTRFNLYRAAEVTGSPAPGYSSGQAMAAIEEVASQVLPAEMGYAWNAMSYQEKNAAGGATVFVLAIVMVFLILAAQYESWSLPFSVLLGTPLAVLGAFLGLFLRDFEVNVFGQIGLVMLIGLAAKNAILIVEFAKLELESGKPLVEAALSGARLRLRPILMTSFAFILGCVPLAIASGAGAVSRQQMGIAVIMGMLVATLLGIFLVPVLFTVIERLTGHGEAHAQPAPAPPAGPAPAPVAGGRE
ncbi:MAG: hydrophobe/amphiphile efflux-1 family RND transporter [Proteobacteria bacterium]|nr:MAG: hydrophobe/amphiphile efflux-1 family RND transporter [Pseudomonadota bacterium]